MEQKKLYLLVGIVIALVVVAVVVSLVYGGEGSTTLSSSKISGSTETSDPESDLPGDSGIVQYVEEPGGDVTTCQTKFDCPDPVTQACWSGICKTASVKTGKYQVWGGNLTFFTEFWHSSIRDWFQAIPIPGQRVLTFAIALRSKNPNVDVSEVNLPSSSIDFFQAMWRYMVEGDSIYEVLGINPNDYELENNVVFKGGKSMEDIGRTGDDLTDKGCLNIPGHARVDGVACIKQQVNNPWQTYFRGRTAVYFPGPDEGGHGGAYYKYVPSSSTKWWNNFVYFVVAVAPKHPQD